MAERVEKTPPLPNEWEDIANEYPVYFVMQKLASASKHASSDGVSAVRGTPKLSAMDAGTSSVLEDNDVVLKELHVFPDYEDEDQSKGSDYSSADGDDGHQSQDREQEEEAEDHGADESLRDEKQECDEKFDEMRCRSSNTEGSVGRCISDRSASVTHDDAAGALVPALGGAVEAEDEAEAGDEAKADDSINDNRLSRDYWAKREERAKDAVAHFRLSMSASKPKPSSSEVFVFNIKYSTSSEQLTTLFSSCGPVASVTMPYDEVASRIKGYAFIAFERAESVQRAIVDLNGAYLNGRPLNVRQKTEFKSTPLQSTRSMRSTRSMGATRTPLSSRSRRHSAFTFPKAMAGHRSAAGCSPLVARSARSPPKDDDDEEEEDHTLFVGNIPFEVGRGVIWKLFAEACDAPIDAVRLVKTDVGLPRGFGYVDCRTEEEAQRGLALNGHVVAGRALRVNRAEGYQPDYRKKKALRMASSASSGSLSSLGRVTRFTKPVRRPRRPPQLLPTIMSASDPFPFGGSPKVSTPGSDVYDDLTPTPTPKDPIATAAAGISPIRSRFADFANVERMDDRTLTGVGRGEAPLRSAAMDDSRFRMPVAMPVPMPAPMPQRLVYSPRVAVPVPRYSHMPLTPPRVVPMAPMSSAPLPLIKIPRGYALLPMPITPATTPSMVTPSEAMAMRPMAGGFVHRTPTPTPMLVSPTPQRFMVLPSATGVAMRSPRIADVVPVADGRGGVRYYVRRPMPPQMHAAALAQAQAHAIDWMPPVHGAEAGAPLPSVRSAEAKAMDDFYASR